MGLSLTSFSYLPCSCAAVKRWLYENYVYSRTRWWWWWYKSLHVHDFIFFHGFVSVVFFVSDIIPGNQRKTFWTVSSLKNFKRGTFLYISEPLFLHQGVNIKALASDSIRVCTIWMNPNLQEQLLNCVPLTFGVDKQHTVAGRLSPEYVSLNFESLWKWWDVVQGPHYEQFQNWWKNFHRIWIKLILRVNTLIHLFLHYYYYFSLLFLYDFFDYSFFLFSVLEKQGVEKKDYKRRSLSRKRFLFNGCLS